MILDCPDNIVTASYDEIYKNLVQDPSLLHNYIATAEQCQNVPEFFIQAIDDFLRNTYPDRTDEEIKNLLNIEGETILAEHEMESEIDMMESDDMEETMDDNHMNNSPVSSQLPTININLNFGGNKKISDMFG